MRVAGVAGRTVTITVRFADFTTITRSRTLAEATDVTQEIYRDRPRLYDALGLQRARVRLVGVRVEGLVARETVHRQLVLGEREHGWSEADRAVDRATSGSARPPFAPRACWAETDRHNFVEAATVAPTRCLDLTNHAVPAPGWTGVTDPRQCWRNVPLSEEELRLLEQMERALVEEDPKFASTLRGTSLRSIARRRAIVAGGRVRRRRRGPDGRCRLRLSRSPSAAS